MPAGAPARTGAVHTSVPAVTSVSAPGAPLVTTCSGSRSGTVITVNCQVPAHSGPVRTVTAAPPDNNPGVRRSSATTWSPPGRPTHGTATRSSNGVGPLVGSRLWRVGGGAGRYVGSGVGL